MPNFFTDILERLTSAYKKKPDSNIGKILSIVANELQNVTDTFEKIDEWRSIDNAKGTTLDNIGTNIDQPRGIASDEVYRILIRSKIARNLSTGDINTIIEVLSIALDADPSEISINELYEDTINPQSATLAIAEIPISRLNQVGMSSTQFVQLVKKIVSAGVKISQIELTGTFEFSSLKNQVEVDMEKGFSNIEGNTGGYFGAIYDSTKSEKLPI